MASGARGDLRCFGEGDVDFLVYFGFEIEFLYVALAVLEFAS